MPTPVANDRRRPMTGWTAADLPDLSGKTAIVTGANRGLGYQTALELARNGAHVLLAARDPARGTAALERLRADAPASRAELVELNVADLDSVRRFAEAFLARGEGLDLLINNAGVMAIPQRALTARLLPALLQRPSSRVVTVSSNRHKQATGIDFDNLQGERHYAQWGAYDQSKLANAMFVLELDRRLRAAGLAVVSVGAHPGFTRTNLQFAGPRSGGTSLAALALALATRLFAQPERQGALPVLYGATAPVVQGGQYFGPPGPGERRGHPGLVAFSAAAREAAAAARLWRVSEELTGVRFEALAAG